MPSISHYRAYAFINIVVAAVIVAGLAHLSLQNFALYEHKNSLVWPTSGFGLAILLIGGNRYAWAVFGGTCALLLYQGETILMASTLSLGNTLQPLLGRWLLRRYRFDDKLGAIEDFGLLATIGALIAAQAAMVGVVSLWVVDILPSDSFVSAFMNWWQGDLLGILIITPLILAWRQWPHDWLDSQRLWELGLFLLSTMLIGGIVFLGHFHEVVGSIAKGYWVFPLTIWGSMRFGIRGATLLITLIALQALRGIVTNVGDFSDDFAETGLMNFWFYMLAIASTAISLALLISSRDEALKELFSSRQRLQLFIEHAPVAIAMLDRDLRYLAISQRWLDDYDIAERDIIHRHHYEVFPQIPERWKTIHQRALAGEILRNESDPMALANGQLIWLRWEVRPWYEADGQIGGIAIFTEDVTELHTAMEDIKLFNHKLGDEINRKTAELRQALQEIEARAALFHAVFENAAIGMAQLDLDGRFTLVNQEYCDMTGYCPEELIGRHFNLLTLEDELGRCLKACEDAIASTEDHFLLEKHYLRKDGGRIWVLIHGQIQRDSQGKALYMIVAASNINDRVEAETRLRAREQQFHALLDAMPDPMVVADDQGRIAMINQQTLKFFGYNEAQMLGQPIEMLIPPSYRHGHVDMRHDYLQSSEEQARSIHTRLMGMGRDIHALTRDGREIPVEISLSQIKTEERSLVVSVLRDVTLRREYEQALQSAKEQAEASAQAKSSFLANMSHEIRTPMNSVLGMAQILEKEDLAPNHRHMVQTILRSGRSLLTIINDILDLSRIESGQLKIDAKDFELKNLLQHLDQLLGTQAREKNLQFSIDLLAIRLIGDSQRLEQVLLNLIANAIKFTHHGSVQVRIAQTPAGADALRLRFDIIDTGVGIDSHILPQLFSPFMQADISTTRRFGGTGLGLAISRRLVELMGGRIGVESELGQGSRFWVELTFKRSLVQSSFVADNLPSNDKTPGLLSGLQVLVVDDDPANLELARIVLNREGAQATLLTDGQQALDTLRATPKRFDAVLMDMAMPILDGFAATKAIREDNHLQGLPVIAVSAGVLPEQQAQMKAAGVDDFLPKPLDIDTVVKTLLRWTQTDRLQATPSAPRPETFIAVSVDKAQLSEALDQLEQQLRSRLVDARQQNDIIQTLLRHSELEADYENIAKAIRGFRFEQALQGLEAFKNQHLAE